MIEKNFAHAMLFCGRNSREEAFNAADKLLCVGQEKPCGNCKGCVLRKAGTHPDFHIIKDEKSIKIEAIRKVQEAVSIKPQRGTHVVLIENADLMTHQAQNALLKTLEEPPKDTFFLLYGKEAGLLQTVISRCSMIRLGESAPVQDELMSKAKELTACVVSKDRELSKKYSALKEEFPNVLDRQALLLREIIAISIGSDVIDNVNREWATANVKGIKAATLQKMLELTLEAKARLHFNANIALTSDWLSIQLARALEQ